MVVQRNLGHHIYDHLTVKQFYFENPNTETLSANKTIAYSDQRVQFLDPGGAARDVTLPAEADSEGSVFLIANKADAAENLTVCSFSEKRSGLTSSLDHTFHLDNDSAAWPLSLLFSRDDNKKRGPSTTIVAGFWKVSP